MDVAALARAARTRHFHMIGLGSVAQSTLRLLFDSLGLASEQLTLIAPEPVPAFTDGGHGRYVQAAVTKDNLGNLVAQRLKPGDIVLNLANDVSSCSLIRVCQEAGALYLDTVIEPWAHWYDNSELTPGERSNYALREQALILKGRGRPTAVLTHGANPGLVSHFLKQALLDLADAAGRARPLEDGRTAWAGLARDLDVRVIQVAEYDSQQTVLPRPPRAFHNTWSVAGFVAEAGQPAELGWGSHERHVPHDGRRHVSGCGAAIYLHKPGAGVRVKSWVPGIGPYQGFLITHGEAISMADYLTLCDNFGHAVYRPTVHYAYRPCDAAVASLLDLCGRQWHTEGQQAKVLMSEISSGSDTLGVLLGYGDEGCYWYGSRLSAEQARALCPGSNATSLQVAAGVLGGLAWAMENPDRGVVEPEEMDSERVLQVARPYLGELFGEFSDWTPVRDGLKLFPRELDHTDPWQFANIRLP